MLGAGVMGAQIAAHLTNADVETVLFDLPAKEGPKNGIVIKAIANLGKLQARAAGGEVAGASAITPANYDEHLDLLSDCDLIIEAIAERMDWKHDLYKKIAPYVPDSRDLRQQHLGPVHQCAGRSAAGRNCVRRFCGMHFFNPPRYMHLVELIPDTADRSDVLDGLEAFLTTTLGKGVVHAKDTPNFIGNRIGVFSMLATMHHTAAVQARLRCGRRPHRPGHRPPEERDLPHRRRGRPGHHGPRHQDHGRHAARRSLAQVLQGTRTG